MERLQFVYEILRNLINSTSVDYEKNPRMYALLLDCDNCCYYIYFQCATNKKY
jgi:hypothetical protein